MAASGKYDSVHLNQKLSTITGDPTAGGQQPDVAGVRSDTKGVDTVEHPSPSQTPESQDAKGAGMQSKLGELGRGGTHETRTTGQALGEVGKELSGKAGKVLGVGGALIAVPGAIMDAQKNPNMSSMELLYRMFGAYDLGVASGQLPAPRDNTT